MKKLVFILSFIVASCAGSQVTHSPDVRQQAIRQQTLMGIDAALTPPIYARDVRHAFELTVAYADSLHNIRMTAYTGSLSNNTPNAGEESYFDWLDKWGELSHNDQLTVFFVSVLVLCFLYGIFRQS